MTYRTESSVSFFVNGRTSSGNLIVREDTTEIELEVTQQSSESNPNLRWEELLVPDVNYIDRVDGISQRVYAKEPPICKEEYDATARRTERSAATGVAGAAAAPRAPRGRFNGEEFGKYKKLVLAEDSGELIDDNSMEDLHQFRVRAAKMLGKGFNVQWVLESKFFKTKQDFEDEEDDEDEEEEGELEYYLQNLQLILDGAAFGVVEQELDPPSGDGGE